MLITVHRTLFYNFISSFHYQKPVVQLKGPKKGNQTGKKKDQERAGILFCIPHIPKAIYDHEIIFRMAHIKRRRAKTNNFMTGMCSTAK
jgi:hypothetical protein